MEETNGTQTAHDAFKRTLREYWGYPDFRGIQRDIIESIAQGKDTLGLMPCLGDAWRMRGDNPFDSLDERPS